LPRFAAVRNTTRGQLILGGIAIGFVLIIAGLGLSQRNLSIQRPSDLGLVFLVVLFMFLGPLIVILVPMPRHYVIDSGLLGYPRWGGLRRGTISLSLLSTFRIEGRDETTATIVLFADGRRKLTIPEDLLADSRLFRDVLKQAGLREEPPRFRSNPR